MEPKEREKNMAGAYGGEAKPELRRPKIKYDKERLANSKKFRISTADEPFVRANLDKLASVSQQQVPKLGEKPPLEQQNFVGSNNAKGTQGRKSTIAV